MLNKARFLLITVVSLLILFSAFCGYRVHILSLQQEKVKADFSIVNNVSFGLLSVSEWRDRIVGVVSHQIETFDLTKEQEANLQKEIEDVLNSLISKAISLINKPKKSLSGKIQKFAFKTFVDTTSLHEQVPAFAKQIMAQIEKPSNKKRLKDIAQSKLQQLGRQTYDSSRNEQQIITDSIYNKYHVPNASEFNYKTTSLLNNLRTQTYNYAYGMLVSTVVILLLWLLLRKKNDLHKTLYLLSVSSALILLVVGLSTTMIELDARIQTLDFKLIGSTISFKNQVLFFQSKSILDVVKILIDTGKWDMIIVGILILAFSVIFPFAKLSSTCIYLLGNEKIASNKFVQFFAFKSGKWSMADVMVVAIMMTYIGFNGVLESQLSALNIHNDTITSITTNNTALQPGYIVFVAFVVFGLILSEILKRITRSKEIAHQ